MTAAYETETAVRILGDARHLLAQVRDGNLALPEHAGDRQRLTDHVGRGEFERAAMGGTLSHSDIDMACFYLGEWRAMLVWEHGGAEDFDEAVQLKGALRVLAEVRLAEFGL